MSVQRQPVPEKSAEPSPSLKTVSGGTPANLERRGLFYAFKFRNFRLFFVGQLISLAGTWMQQVAQQWLVFSITKSAAWLGIVSGAGAIPYLAFAIWGGHIADSRHRRNTLVWTQTVSMLLAFVLAFLATNKWVTIQGWHVAALAFLMGIVNAFNTPAQQAFVTDMVEDRKALGNAIALNSLMFNMARFAGPIIAGSILVKLGSAWCFGLNGLSYLAVIASLLLMRLPEFSPAEHQHTIWDGFAFIRNNKQVLRILLLVGAASIFVWSFSTLFPIFATNFHRGAKGFTGMMAANGVGAALGGIFVASMGHLFPRRNLLYGGAMVFCAGLILFTTATTYWVALGWLLLCGFAMISFGINANTKIQEDVPDALRGRVMALYSMVFMGLMPLGGLEIGFLAEHLNAAVAVRINAAICFVITIALLGWSRAEQLAGQRARAVVD
jgi:MFS family permease